MGLTMVEKLSSARTMSEASLATSVPAMPMATPMSASFSAGASFTPSPVMAATCTSTPHGFKNQLARRFILHQIHKCHMKAFS